MNRTTLAADSIQSAAVQFRVQHLAVPLDIGSDVSRMESPQVAAGDRSICSPPERVEVATSQFTFGHTIAEVSLCAALLLGTGSARQDLTWMTVKRATAARHAADHIHPLMVTTPSRALAVIRTAFPLQISQIAEILGVSRPTIYAWIGDEQQPQPRCQDRLNQIYSLAEFWNNRCNLPAPEKIFESPDSAGVSLIDMLKAASINVATVKNRLEDIVRSVKSSKRLGIVESARLRGFKLPAEGNSTAEFDVITRRPMDES